MLPTNQADYLTSFSMEVLVHSYKQSSHRSANMHLWGPGSNGQHSMVKKSPYKANDTTTVCESLQLC